METENLMENAQKKRERKNADWILANHLKSQPNGVFNADENEIVAVSAKETHVFKGPKKTIASEILTFISEN